MIIGQIKDGIVLDHITAGLGMTLYNFLGLDELDCQVALIKNAESVKMGRKDIIKIHLEKRHRNPSDFNLDKIADNTKEFAGAELEEIVVSGLYDAFDEGIDLQQKHLDVAISTMVPLSKTMADQIKDLREWAKIRARKASDITWEDDNSGIRKLELESGAEQ